MKITQKRVTIPLAKGATGADEDLSQTVASKIGARKPGTAAPPPAANTPGELKKPIKPVMPAASSIRDKYSDLKGAATAVQRIRISAQQELEQIHRMRADALRYQQETAAKARSDANQLILHARLATQREVEELIRQASEEIQKILADIRVIRITAQEELAAQRKFTNAAKLSSMSISLKGELAGTEKKSKKPLVITKSLP